MPISIFAETANKAISDYRLLLRRHLNQVDRMTKLQKLCLRDAKIYKNDLALYHTCQTIITDIKENLLTSQPVMINRYHTYSGIRQFCEYLETYLNNYVIEGDRVAHRGQKASSALLKSIQLITLSHERLDETVAKVLTECNKTIVACGSREQCELQLQTLTCQEASNPGFFVNIVTHLESLMMGGDAAAA